MTNAPLTFRPACETDLFEIVEMLADDPLGELREDLRAAARGLPRGLFRNRKQSEPVARRGRAQRGDRRNTATQLPARPREKGRLARTD
ncbi:hypothetical protein [Sagittula salina]|uniref:Uncharacterized protein n=1 Tax=Sagittula salina TaxID=2820268 RepID=A0A940S2F7_9RHOB|nr:hypothetical protein [Sagittula salina]MBP0485193.1 hypothetical protein [Sagittula salina]